jgi:hypothetical protein
MILHRIALSWLLVAATVPAPAQTCAYNSGVDPAGGNGLAALLYPPTSALFRRTHVVVPAVVFQNVPLVITDIAVATIPGYRRMKFDRLTIRMGHTTVGQANTIFGQNITSPLQDVLVARDHVFFEGFGPAWVPVGLQTSFQFLPGSGNLLIEVVAEGGLILEGDTSGAAGGSLLGSCVTSSLEPTLPTVGNSATVPRLRFCFDRAEVSLSGESCNGSAGSTPLLGVTGRPTPGSMPTLWLSDAPANALAACAYGFDTKPPFPINLTALGAPGCRQYFAPAFADFVLANPLGIGERAISVPSATATIGAILYAQYYVLDPPANALDLTASNYARLLVGL